MKEMITAGLILLISLGNITSFASLTTKDGQLLIEQFFNEQHLNGQPLKAIYIGNNEKAVYIGNNEEVERLLLETGVNIDAQDKYGNTLLHWAARKGHTDAVGILIDKSANLETVDKFGYTPLRLAAKMGNKDTVALLIERGAQLEAQDYDGMTSLHWATWNGKTDVVELLIEKKAHIEAAAKNGDTPLHFAASGGYEKLVRLLIKKGAYLEAVNKDGWTPLHFALDSGLSRPKDDNYSIIVNMLLLFLPKFDTFSKETQKLLEKWGFDQQAFGDCREKGIMLLKDILIPELEGCKVPKAVALIIIDYYNDLATRELFFKKAKLITSKEQQKKRKLFMNDESDQRKLMCKFSSASIAQ